MSPLSPAHAACARSPPPCGEGSGVGGSCIVLLVECGTRLFLDQTALPRLHPTPNPSPSSCRRRVFDTTGGESGRARLTIRASLMPRPTPASARGSPPRRRRRGARDRWRRGGRCRRPGRGSAPPSGRGSGPCACRPWRRSTSWQPGMQPAKSLATSKITALQSVTMASSASSSSGTAPRPPQRVDLLQQRHRRLHPHAPVAEQAALEAQRRLPAAVADGERRDEVGDDVIVVAGVERDALLGAGRRPRRRPRPASCSG